MCLVGPFFIYCLTHKTLTCTRLILYFPVSALVTLFGNILQNPLDVRAKSDTRLMGLVVTFLSMLGQEAEQGGVHRMLGVCSEFVRIAKLVIEKAENDQSFRRKRSTNGKVKGASKNVDTSEVPIPTTIEELSPPVRTQRSSSWGPVAATSPSEEQKSPKAANGNDSQQSTPQQQHQQYHPQQHHQQQHQQHQQIPQNGDFDSFNAMSGAGGYPDPSAMVMDHPFHQPLLPQDLFALPMTLDWNWAEMSGGAYPSVENGNFGDPPQ